MNLDFQYLFTSFEGRINRAKYWAGTIILAIISIPVSMSVFLAREFAQTNNSLKQKLDEADPFLRYWVDYLSKRVIDLSAQ